MIYGNAVLAWVVLLFAIALLGAARETFFAPWLDQLPAHQIGTGAACLVVLAASYFFVRALAPSRGQALTAGALWLWPGLALPFEFLFFHFDTASLGRCCSQTITSSRVDC